VNKGLSLDPNGVCIEGHWWCLEKKLITTLLDLSLIPNNQRVVVVYFSPLIAYILLHIILNIARLDEFWQTNNIYCKSQWRRLLILSYQVSHLHRSSYKQCENTWKSYWHILHLSSEQNTFSSIRFLSSS